MKKRLTEKTMDCRGTGVLLRAVICVFTLGMTGVGLLQAGFHTPGGQTVAAATAAPSTGSTSSPSSSGQPAVASQEPAISVMDAPIEEKVTKKGLIYEYTGLEARLIGCTNKILTKTSLTIPSKICVKDIYYDVTVIDCKALQGCTQLKKVTLGRYVKQIRYGAFRGDTHLKSIVFKGKKLDSVGERAFDSTAGNLVFRMPKSVVAKYKKLLRKGSPSVAAQYKKR